MLTRSPICPRFEVSLAQVLVHVEPVGKLDWCEPVQARMGPVVIVVVTPCFDDMLGVTVTGRHVLVQ